MLGDKHHNHWSDWFLYAVLLAYIQSDDRTCLDRVSHAFRMHLSCVPDAFVVSELYHIRTLKIPRLNDKLISSMRSDQAVALELCIPVHVTYIGDATFL